MHRKLDELIIPTMAPDTRRRHVVSYENMSEELAAIFSEKYPKGIRTVQYGVT